MRSFILAIGVLATIAVLMVTRSEPQASIFDVLPHMPCDEIDVPDAQILWESCTGIDWAYTQDPGDVLFNTCANAFPCIDWEFTRAYTRTVHGHVIVDLGGDYVVGVSDP